MIKTKFTDLNFQDPYARHCLAYGGGKAGLLQYTKEKLPKVAEYVPDGVFINSADASDPAKLENILKSVESSENNPKIVRGCTSFVQGVSSPEQEAINDFCGVVDVLKTSGYTESRESLPEFADWVIYNSKEKEVASHLQWEFDTKFDGNIGLLVQDYKEWVYRGYLVEHPSEEGIFILEKLDKNTDMPVAYKVEDVGKNLHGAMTFIEVKRLIPLYKELKDSGLMPKDYTFQIEYCLDEKLNPWILQVRLFRRKEERANFDLPSYLNGRTFSNHAFGITPKDGISLPLTDLNSESIKSFKDKKTVAYTEYSSYHRSPPLEIQPENLTAFIAQSFGNSFLGHGYTRFMMKADVGFAMDRIMHTPHRIRVFSNGITGGYIRE